MTKRPEEWLAQYRTTETRVYAGNRERNPRYEQEGFTMDKAAVRQVIKDFQKALELKKIKVEKFILYGSYAQERFHEGSDIDLIVVSPDFAGKSYWQRIDVISEAIYEVFQPIEAVAMTPDEWERKDSLIAQYASTGEEIPAA